MILQKITAFGRLVVCASFLTLVSSMVAGTALAASEADAVKEASANLQKMVPDLPIDEIAATPLPGIFEVISDGQIYYVGQQGRYLFEGSLIDLEKQENLTSSRQSSIAMAQLSQMDESDMLIFEPDQQSAVKKKSGVGKAETASGDAVEPGSSEPRTITVFTDTSCPYCSRLHEEIGALMAANIRVRYLLYPRAGLDSDAARQLESVWCADNPQEAMTTAKAGGDVPAKSCDNPIESHIALANKVGLRGTPMIFLDDGEVVPGYRPAADLVKMIETSSPL